VFTSVETLVLYEYGLVWEELGNYHQSVLFLVPAAENMKRCGYPANYRALAAVHARQACISNVDNDAAGKCLDLILDAIEDIFRDRVYGDDRPLLVRAIHGLVADLSAEQRHVLSADVEDIPRADPVALLVLKGCYDQARPSLTKAWEMDGTVSEPASEMVRISRFTGDGKEMRMWFDRAVAARFDDPLAYDNYLDGIRSGPLGGRKVLLDFGAECLATGRFDTAVPLKFIETLVIVRDEYDRGDASDWGGHEVYDAARETFEKSLAPGGVYAGSDYLRSMEAAFEVQAGHWDDARTAMSRLTGGLDGTATAVIGLTPEEVAGTVLVYTGPDSENAVRGQNRAAWGKPQEALREYQAAIDRQKDPTALRFLRGIAQRLRWEIDFQAGKPVALNADASFSGFRPIEGRWQADSDGALIAISPDNQKLYLRCDADFGDHWELSADVDFLGGNPAGSFAGLALGMQGTANHLGLGIAPGLQKFAANDETTDPVKLRPGTIGNRNRLTLRRDGGRIVLAIDRQTLYDAPCDDTESNRLKIGFGGFRLADDQIIRFRRVSIRRTTE